MFYWLFNKRTSTPQGLKSIRSQFCQMLVISRRAFQLAVDSYLRILESEEVREELFDLDRQINKAERQIRKELVIHTTVHGTADFDQCLVMMSIVKDAERLGDIAKNVYDLSVDAPDAPSGTYLEKLETIKKSILGLADRCVAIFDSQEEDEAKKLIVQAARIEDMCDENILLFLTKQDAERADVAYTLAFRYIKRFASHLRNITSSIVMPVHKLDFTGKIVRKNSDLGTTVDE